MFKSVINSTPLVSDAANSFFQNIRGDYFQRDVTFVSTLRALVAPRMADGDSITLSFSETSYTVGNVRNNSTRAVVNAICGHSYAAKGYTGQIQIHNFESQSQEDNYACLELMKSSFEQQYEGWHRLNKVTDFFRKTFYVLCFINPEKKSVYIFADRMDVKKMHYLQCSIFAFLPWYFDPEAGVSESEMELINSLREKKSDKYEDCIVRIASQYDFRTQRIRNLLAGFETRYERQECEAVRRQIQEYIDEIQRLDSQIGECLRYKSDKEIRLLGLEAKIAQGDTEDSEIMEYFLCNNKLVLEEVTDTYMVFSCMDYLTYFDEDMAKQMIDNKRSYVYRPNGRACNNFIQEDDMKKLMYAIFIDQMLRIKMCCAYRFELNGSVSGLSGHRYGYEFRECTPNTHIDRYSCMGNYKRTINQLLTNHDYIGAIEQCIASCKSLNFADSTVMEEFMRRLYGISDYEVNIRCIELPDGKVVTPKEAVEWIKANEPQEQETESVQQQEGETESNE